jgi:CD2 antigen cytoplasmic tail-binding protein 2
MSRPLPRPKRAGEEFARSHLHDPDGPSSSKKPRFDVRNPSALAPDAPEEDAILDADVIGKGGQQAKRNAVNIDGYDSDSENEGFDARAELKAKAASKGGQNADEEEGDMFADLEDDLADGDEDEDLLGEGKKKKKDVRFLDEDEIEGQVANSKSGGHVSVDFSWNGGANGKGKGRQVDKEAESSSESEVDEEQRAEVGDEVDKEIGAGGKKSHAPKLDAFNMRNEQEEGRFDDQGNYVRKAADPDAVHDSWLDGVSKKDIKKAKEAAEKRDEERRQRDIANDALLTSDILKTLIPFMEKGETVLETLARFGKSKDKKRKWQNAQRRRKQSNMDVDKENNENDAAEQKRKDAVEAITGAADQLLTRGQMEIYEAERELLVRQYRRETGEEWVDSPEERDINADGTGVARAKQWEYRWADARDGGETHGPYDGAMMVSWSDAGYFGEGVEFRRAEHDGEWSRAVDFV